MTWNSSADRRPPPSSPEHPRPGISAPNQFFQERLKARGKQERAACTNQHNFPVACLYRRAQTESPARPRRVGRAALGGPTTRPRHRTCRFCRGRTGLRGVRWVLRARLERIDVAPARRVTSRLSLRLLPFIRNDCKQLQNHVAAMSRATPRHMRTSPHRRPRAPRRAPPKQATR